MDWTGVKEVFKTVDHVEANLRLKDGFELVDMRSCRFKTPDGIEQTNTQFILVKRK